MSKDDHLKWKKVGERTFKGAYKTYKTKTLISPDGIQADFDVTAPKYIGFVGVFALTPEREVIVVKQYRPGPEKVLYDEVLGILDQNEQPANCARREMREETGYEPGLLIALSKEGSIVGPYHEEVGFYFLALDCVLKHDQQLDELEKVEIVTMPIKDFVNKYLRTGQTSHADGPWLAIDYMLQNGMLKLEEIAK